MKGQRWTATLPSKVRPANINLIILAYFQHPPKNGMGSTGLFKLKYASTYNMGDNCFTAKI